MNPTVLLMLLRNARVSLPSILVILLGVTLAGQHLYFRVRMSAKDEIISDRNRIINQLQGINAELLKLKPGQTETITIPGKVSIVKVPYAVVVTKTETQFITKTEPIVLPPEEIEKLVQIAPQSIQGLFTATRDIKKGEQFMMTFVQQQPGIWVGLLTPDAPVTADITSRITQLPTITDPKRLTVRALGGYSTLGGAYARLEVEYRLNGHTALLKQIVRLEDEYRFQRRENDVRLSFGLGW